jgi:hypothetical protein
MKNDNSELFFIKDLVCIIKEMLQETKKSQDNQFETGRHFAFYEILSLIEQQAIAFGYDKNDIGMDSFNPDNNI